MDILGMILSASKGDALSKLANQYNISTDQTSAVLSQLMPELTNRVEGNVQQENGLNSLLAALSKGNHQRYMDEPDLLTENSSLLEGNKILGHLLGSKEASRQIASQVEGSTGVSAGIIKKLLPMAATMLMGALSKGSQSNGLLDQLTSSLSGKGQNDLLGSLLGSLTQGSKREQSNSADLVGSLLKNFLK
ncbi:MAG: hypothetical protein COB23_01035 [Methylophaga sp.]|nr:MAG: hypothetical protein COB23_01035 [Methylophaga sp.]